MSVRRYRLKFDDAISRKPDKVALNCTSLAMKCAIETEKEAYVS